MSCEAVRSRDSGFVPRAISANMPHTWRRCLAFPTSTVGPLTMDDDLHVRSQTLHERANNDLAAEGVVRIPCTSIS
jgi:hypothetical protein